MSQLLNWIRASKGLDRCALTYRNSGYDDYKNVSYDELYDYIISLSGYLSNYKEKTIAIIGNNKIEYVVSLLSALCCIGDVFVVDKELNQEGLDSLFSIVKPDLIILDDEIKLADQNVDVLKFSLVSEIMNSGLTFDVDDSFAGNLILHTSGTTGTPKCIKLSEDMYLYIIKDLNTAWKVTHKHSCLFIIPLYHIYALTSLFHGLYAGVRNILEWDYSRLNSVLQQTNPSIFLGVPLIFNKIKDTAYEKGGSKLKFGLAFSNFLMRFKIDIRKKLFKDLHAYFGNDYYFSVCGGSVANPSTNKFFNDIGLPLYNGYGMTETSGPITICYENNNRYDSVGKILHNDIKVINSDENGVGEICIAGANIIKQYVNNENADCFADGYFNTGDLGYVKDGFLYITGRKKEILIGDNGKNISTAELLEKIMRHPGINDCVLKMENNKILAIIDTSLSSDDVSKHIEAINATLPNFKKISNFKIIQKGFKEKPDL
jgi:long-chain acyl-CoA synthetase